MARDNDYPVDVVFNRDTPGYVSAIFEVDVNKPYLIQAYGMNPDARIWVEQIRLTPEGRAFFMNDCHCCLVDLPESAIESVSKIPCATYDHDERGVEIPHYARVTAHNVVVWVNLPQHTYFQLRWEGVGFPGDLASSPGDRNVVVSMRRAKDGEARGFSVGCPIVPYDEAPSSFIHTGLIRCAEPDYDPTHPTVPPRRDMVEWQYAKEQVYEDGHHEASTVWQDKQPITWVDTGATREYCNVGTDTVSGANPPAVPDVPGTDPSSGATVDTSYERQQVSDCGNVRWVQTDCMYWRRTGVTRIKVTGEALEAQEVNQFGRYRWVAQWCPVAPIAINPDDPWFWIPHWTVPDGVQDRAEGTIERAGFTLTTSSGSRAAYDLVSPSISWAGFTQQASTLTDGSGTINGFTVPALSMAAVTNTVSALEITAGVTEVPELTGTLPEFVGRFPGYESVDTLMARRYDRFNVYVAERCYAFATASDDPAATVAIVAQAPGVGGTAYIYPSPRPDAPVAVWSRPIPDDYSSPSMILGYARRDPLGNRLQPGAIASPGA